MDNKHLSRTVSDILGMVSEMAFFNQFETQELYLVAKHLSIRIIKKGEVLFEEGDKGNYMCFVVDGLLNVLKDTEDEKNVIVSMITRGKSLGEMAVLDLSTRSATVVAAKKTTLVIMQRENFNHILEHNPKAGVKLLSGVARLLSLYLRQATGRLARELAAH